MAKQIILSGRGKSSLHQMVNYIQVEFSDEAASALIERFIDKANWVAKYPESGQTTPFKTVRSIKFDRNRRFTTEFKAKT